MAFHAGEDLGFSLSWPEGSGKHHMYYSCRWGWPAVPDFLIAHLWCITMQETGEQQVGKVINHMAVSGLALVALAELCCDMCHRLGILVPGVTVLCRPGVSSLPGGLERESAGKRIQLLTASSPADLQGQMQMRLSTSTEAARTGCVPCCLAPCGASCIVTLIQHWGHGLWVQVRGSGQVGQA